MSKHRISLGIYPPRIPDQAGLGHVVSLVNHFWNSLGPESVSVMGSSGGSGSTAGTVAAVSSLLRECGGLSVVPHVLCHEGNEEALTGLLDTYLVRLGIKDIFVLRGDAPSGTHGSGGVFSHASDLVAFIRSRYAGDIGIGVACYPETHVQASGFRMDFGHFQCKVAAGATYAITQYFYNPDAYFWFLDDCQTADIDIPIIPGIMPMGDFSRLQQMAKIHGVEVPRWIATRMFGYDAKDQAAFGLDVVADMCLRLIDRGVSRLHLFTMNDPGRIALLQGRLGFGTN